MAGVKGLVKKINPQATSPAADEFINGAKVDGKNSSSDSAAPVSQRVYKRVTFSLTDELDKEIDRLSLIPRGFRASKSDVVRAAVALLGDQSDEEISRLLQSVQVK